jgi:hypothetical protein
MTVIVTAKLGPRRERGSQVELLVEPPDLIAHMRDRGCLHHQVVDLDGDWWLIEEWEAAERFEDFFDRTPEFRRALRAAGFREFPDELRLWRSLEEPGPLNERGQS